MNVINFIDLTTDNDLLSVSVTDIYNRTDWLWNGLRWRFVMPDRVVDKVLSNKMSVSQSLSQ